jgi:uncharacterized protein (TIGR02453 family)
MNPYPGLPRALPRFLTELAAHNNKDWFDAHRAAYESDWKAAGLDLIEALGPFCAAAAPRLEAVPKIGGSLHRIQRDTRFSADKSPYAPMLHVVLALPGGEKHRGMHLVLHPDRLAFGAGHYGLEPQALARLRARVQQPADRAALLEAAARAEAAGSCWDAPDLKRLPKGLEAGADWEHLLRRKSVILRGETTGLPDWLFTPDCPAGLETLIAAHLPLLGWLAR